MPPSPTLIITLAICANVVVVLGGFWMWLSHRARRRIPDHELASELRHLRESVDALGVEVERIAESQRYTARLLHDASTMRATFPSHPPKAITPH
jgi:uncharacterized iron-regulated membrane protein